MLISPLTSNFSSFPLQGIGGIGSLLSPQSSQGLSAFSNSSTIVTLSGLGQVLSAAATFENKLAALQPGTTRSGLGQNFGSDFGSLAAEAQSFVDSFNTLSSRVASLQAPSAALSATSSLFSIAGESLVSRFAQALNTQATAPLANGTSTLTKLSQIGINFQPASSTDQAATLSIDLKGLQTAFTSDQAGTFSLLSQAARSFAATAAGFTEQAGNASAALGNLGLAGVLQSDLTGLFGLGSPSQRATFGQQILAVNQFNLVSSLLGNLG